MAHVKSLSLILLGAMWGFAFAAYAQQPPDASKAQPAAAAETPDSASTPATTVTVKSATTATAAAAAPATPSAEMLKKARLTGYHTKVRNGITMFCKTDATIGTRFVTEKCIDESTLWVTLDREQYQRDQMQKSSCNGACGAK